MAANHNPFAAWAQTNNSDGSGKAPPPSIMGALPYPQSSYPLAPDNHITFTFTSFNPTILNCTVLGPHNRPYFYVTTDSSMLGYTVLKDVKATNVALVEWQNSPLLEVRGVLSKQKIADCLKLASDQSKRTIEVRGNSYAWAPYDRYICLYSMDASAPRTLARICKSFDIVSLEMTPSAMELGLLEICVVTTVLLQCGRNID